MRTFSAEQWVEDEIDSMMDLYNNTRGWAILNIIDFLQEGSYDDELTDEQTNAALEAARKLRDHR